MEVYWMRKRHHLILGVPGSLEKMKIRCKITERSESRTDEGDEYLRLRAQPALALKLKSVVSLGAEAQLGEEWWGRQVGSLV